MNYIGPLRNVEFQGFFTPWRLTWYPRAFLFALSVAFLIAIFTGEGASTLTGRLGGDYPAFYAAGKIIAQGDWGNLYNSKKQAAMQCRRAYTPASIIYSCLFRTRLLLQLHIIRSH